MKTLFVCLLAATTFVGQARAQKQVPITPVTGESWLSHLHRALEETSMGKTDRLGPATLLPASEEPETGSVKTMALGAADPSVTLRGTDLYRLNCRACHGEFGLGAPPEINSVIGATRATSAPLIMARMKERGLGTSRAQANELANQAKGTLLERLHKGGVEMPPFPHLSDLEARAIFAYLRQLAEIPGAETQQVRVDESSLQIGERIVKSTCHTCHNAAGFNPSADELMQGAIPPLSTLTTRVSLPEFERKVRHGAPIMMGTPLLPYRGRMPVFDYLSESEIADAYLYLKMFPPSAWTDPVTPPARPQMAGHLIPIASHEPPNDPANSGATEGRVPVLAVVACVFVGLLMAAGIAFTVYDVKHSKVKGGRFVFIGGEGLAVLPAQDAPIPVGAVAGSSGATVRQHTHKRAAPRSRFERSDYSLFEGPWFWGRFEDDDEAA